jgi:glycosyltransferase involved in cell wall biosynthesis
MVRPLRVLHVIPSVGPLRGGPSVMVRMMARGLAHAGLEVHVAATDDNGHGRLDVPHAFPVVEDGVTYHYFPRQTRFYGVSWPLGRWLAGHVRDYDLVHVHALFSFAAVPAAYWAARAGVPYVVRPLGTLNRWGMEHRRPWLKRLSFAIIERRILQGAARIHYTSEQEQIEAAELGLNRRQAVVPLGIDLAPFAELPPRGWLRQRASGWAGRPVALFLSRLDPKKGLDLLLAAFALARAQRPDLALVIAGSGDASFERGVRRDAARLGLGDSVYWAGFLSGKEKLAALADADLFVLPSYSENFGVAAVEAMAARLPVVISDQVGIHREVAAARAGVVVPCERELLADALLRVASDASLRAELGARAQDLVRRRFSIQAMTAAVATMYEEVLRASHMPGELGSRMDGCGARDAQSIGP